MKKKSVIAILLLLFIIVISLNVFQYWKSNIHSGMLSGLKGSIYYTERVDGVLTLFKSDATLQNKKRLYSHKGKGKDGYGGNNDNIIDFYYNKTNQTIYFIAMNNGTWTLFSLKEGEVHPILLREQDMLTETDYIQNQLDQLSVSSKQGSIYLKENGKEKIIKKFYGIYDGKFTGYGPIGFSPDGKYFIYYSMEHLTPFGTILEGMFKTKVGNTYIMDLSTMKSTKYMDADQIQWIIE